MIRASRCLAQRRFFGMLNLEKLQSLTDEGKIDTVVVAFTDIYGRMMGKTLTSSFFLESCAAQGTHACNYLLSCDMHMNPQSGFAQANWDSGYGDFHLVPDLSTLRHAAWRDGTAMVQCDVLDTDQTTGEEVPLTVAPRMLLKQQLEQMKNMGFDAKTATELEFYCFKESIEEATAKDFALLTPVSSYMEDYHLLQTAREEPFMREARRALEQSGVPVENSKGEAGRGQHELNVRYGEPLAMADHHSVYKQCLRELADQHGFTLTFMSKPYTDYTGSGCHIHLSLWKDGKNAFVGGESCGPVKNCSPIFRHFLGGWLTFTHDVMPLFAPNVNSYKRFQSESWAPTKLAWCADNRTCSFRAVGSGPSLRIELRLPGADVNPYLALAGAIATGLEGIRQQVEPPVAIDGNVYGDKDKMNALSSLPTTLTKATDVFENSEFAKRVFGEEVVQHYARFFRCEQLAFEKAVTDFERKRYLEQI